MTEQTLRLVSWNVCDGFRRKFGHLERLRPDIAVLQEVRPECLRYATLHEQSFWIGDPGAKGMAVVAWGDWKLTPAPVAVNEKWFLPVIATRGDQTVHIVAVWVDSSKDCGPPTLRALDALAGFIAAAPTVLAGDFNQSVNLDARKGRGRRFADVLERFEALGLTSAWHSHTGETQGQETGATLYFTWNAEKRFHIDFAFGSAGLGVDRVGLGGYQQYVAEKISDHVPLTIDYRLPSAAAGASYGTQ